MTDYLLVFALTLLLLGLSWPTIRQVATLLRQDRPTGRTGSGEEAEAGFARVA